MRECDQIRERLIGVAEGQPDQGVQAHVEGCAACQRLLRDMTAILSELSQPYEEPSQAALERAFSIVSRSAQTTTLGSSTFQLAGVRGEAVPSSFQVVHGFPGGQVRVMYQKQGDQWSVMARATQPVTYVHGDSVLAPDKLGAVSFSVSRLSAAELEILAPAGHFVLPSPVEA